MVFKKKVKVDQAIEPEADQEGTKETVDQTVKTEGSADDNLALEDVGDETLDLEGNAPDSNEKKDTKDVKEETEGKESQDRKPVKDGEKKEEEKGFFSRIRSTVATVLGRDRAVGKVWNIYDCDLSLEELEELKMLSVFSEKELKIIRLRFRDLSDEEEWIEKDDICKLDEVKHNPLKKRIAECFESDGDGYIDFREFVIALSHFSPNGSREKKLNLAFKIHDYDGDDKINRKDLKTYLQDITRFKRTEEEIQERVDREAEEKKRRATKSVESRINFNKKRIDELKEEAKKEKKKLDPQLVLKYTLRIKELESEGVLDSIVDLTFDEASSDREYLTRDDFVRVIGHSDFHNKIVLDLTQVKVINKPPPKDKPAKKKKVPKKKPPPKKGKGKTLKAKNTDATNENDKADDKENKQATDKDDSKT